jgi:hypothetical protein
MVLGPNVPGAPTLQQVLSGAWKPSSGPPTGNPNESYQQGIESKVDHVPPPGSTSANTAYNTASGDIKDLTYGQEQDPGSSELTSLSALLGQMTPSQASSFLSSIKGTNLASALTDVSGGESVGSYEAGAQQAANPSSVNQLDPLATALSSALQSIIPSIASTTSAQNSSSINSLSAALSSALSGASPQMQGAMKGVDQSLTLADQLNNQTATQSIATAPEYANFISNLQTLSNNYKLAQQAAGIMPYISAMEGTGSAPTTGSSGAAAQIADQLLLSEEATGNG